MDNSKTIDNAAESKLTMTLQGKEGAIGIRKNTVKALGCPRYICLRISKKGDSLLIRPCESIDVMSYEMPEDFLKSHHVNFRIHSQMFVQTLLKNHSLNKDQTYILDGMLLKNNSAAVFSLLSAHPFNSAEVNEDS